jgi:hypothetical protein
MGTSRSRWLGLAFFAVLLLPPLHMVQIRAQTADYGAVHGVVLRYDGTPLLGGEVELSSREEDFAVQVGPDGKFNLHARPGVYSLKVTEPGILPFQRAQIVIRAGSVVHLNIRPVFADPDPNLHYFSFSVPGPIQLGAVMRRVDLIRPKPRESFGQDYPMLSYDSLSVYAQSLECDRRSLRCEAEGNVLIEMGTEDGVRTERASKVEILLTQRTLILTREESVEAIGF